MTDPKITDKNQGHPDQTAYERAFLDGVLEEARFQGYSVSAQGRLWVRALRTLEGR